MAFVMQLLPHECPSSDIFHHCLLQINATTKTVTAADSNSAELLQCDPNQTSFQSHSSSLSKQQVERRGSLQTQISNEATSCIVDDIDTDSSVPSVSEQNYSNGSQTDPPVYVTGDTYSIVGSLNPQNRGTFVSGSSGTGLYTVGVPLLNMCTLPRKDLTTKPGPGGLFENNRGWACGVQVTRTESTNPQPLRMEDLLNIRLDQVTFDLSQPPYDSLQTYEFEGRDSRAESLSSLESDGEKDDGRMTGGMEELNQKFQRLVEIISEREKEKDGGGGETLSKIHKQKGDKEQQKWDF